MKLLGDLIMVRPIKEEEVTDSGIVLATPVSVKKKRIGEVIMVGDKARAILPGDRVEWFIGCGVPVDYLGEDCLFLRESTEVIMTL